MQYVFAFPCVFMVILEGFTQRDFLREKIGCFYHDLHGFNGDIFVGQIRKCLSFCLSINLQMIVIFCICINTLYIYIYTCVYTDSKL